MQGLHLLQGKTKFCRQINGGNQSTVNRTTDIQRHATIEKNLVATQLAMECF
jgi:hypothetical protein